MDIIIKKQELENISSLLPTIIYNELLKFTEEPISIEGDVTIPTTESVVETKIDKSVLLIKIKLFKKALEKDKSNKVLKIKIKLFEKELTKYADGGGVGEESNLGTKSININFANAKKEIERLRLGQSKVVVGDNDVKYLVKNVGVGRYYIERYYANGGGVGEVYKLIDGENTWYLTYLDSTHFFLSNTKEYKGSPYHIGEFRSRPFYNEVLSWLNSNKGKMAKGGGVDYNENREMVLNDNKQIAHHTKELQNAVKGKKVPAWVVAKVNRSASDISDSTHYMEGQGESYADGGSIKIGDKVMLPEIKMRDGKIQFEKVENGEVIEIQDGIYSVLNPKTNRIHQVSLNQIKFNNGGSLEEIISTQISKYNKELRKLKSDYRGDWFDTSHEGFLAIDKGERASDWEFHGEEFSEENLKKMFALYPNAKYIIFSTRLNGRSDENENESGVALDHSIMEFYVPKYANGGGVAIVGGEKVTEQQKDAIIKIINTYNESWYSVYKYSDGSVAIHLVVKNNDPKHKEKYVEYIGAIGKDGNYKFRDMEKYLDDISEYKPKFTYAKGGSMASGGVFNGKYLDTISSDKKNKILKNIANNYGFSIAEALAEVVDADAEMLYEYISNDQSLRMSVYNDIEGGKFAKGTSIKGLFSKAKEFGSKGYGKAKELTKKGVDATKKAIHDKKKEIALDVLYETKENLAEGRDEKNATEKAFRVVDERFAKGNTVKSGVKKWINPDRISKLEYEIATIKKNAILKKDIQSDADRKRIKEKILKPMEEQLELLKKGIDTPSPFKY